MEPMNVPDENDCLGLPPGLEHENDAMSSSSNSEEQCLQESSEVKPWSKNPGNQRDREASGDSCDRWQALAPSAKPAPFSHESYKRHNKKWTTAAAQQSQCQQQGPSRVRDEIRDGIGQLVLGSSVLIYEDFDYRVRQHLHALHGSRGQQGLRDALEGIGEATVDKTREEIACWPAYLCSLLRVQISEAKQQSAQSKPQRARKFRKQAVIDQAIFMFRASFFVALAYLLVHSLLQAASYVGFGRLESIVGFLVCGYFLEDKFRFVFRSMSGSKASLPRTSRSVETPSQSLGDPSESASAASW